MKIKNPWNHRESANGEFFTIPDKPVLTYKNGEVYKIRDKDFLYVVEGVAVSERCGAGINALKEIVDGA
jgi:hypothetical protein